ncbi:GNAT family N-acetyltransferase [Pseudalkalibacillus hwajinpoensis]|uniref:GNAT family N-acetyltransferase n=2 Tax=Guptibacillus hwajinpoensis TaxID=208199 RepID=A0A4U1MP72_9BACL|nr:GNAT family N-acetyltransferase [Pseudalkalibacillus hwajinpoensis]
MVYDPCEYNIQPTQEEHQVKLGNLFTTLWGSTEMIVSSGVYDISRLDGFIAYNESGDISGVITYYFHESFLEIISLDSLVENNGVGSRLLMEVEIAAFIGELNEVSLLTTNDNLKALRFYQRKGYRLTSIKSDAVNQARVQKPEIPEVGYHQIPVHDELELRKKLKVRATI